MSGKRMMVIAALALLAPALLAPALLVAGCGGGSGPGGSISFTDDSGNRFTLDEPAERVVSLAPSNTEIVYWLGAEAKLVGVTAYCDYPAAAKKKPRIGDFVTPNIERIAAAQPQVVLAASGLQDAVAKSLEGLGIKVLVIDPVDMDGVMTGIRRVARVLGVEDQASGKIAGLERRVEAVRDGAAGLDARSVFFEVYNQPLTAAGSETLIDSMISDAGGKNVGAAAGSRFPMYSQEQLFNEDPYALVAVKGSQANPKDISARPGYEKLTAVKEGRVFAVEDNLFVRSGARTVDGLEMLASIVHPERFGEFESGGR